MSADELTRTHHKHSVWKVPFWDPSFKYWKKAYYKVIVLSDDTFFVVKKKKL